MYTYCMLQIYTLLPVLIPPSLPPSLPLSLSLSLSLSHTHTRPGIVDLPSEGGVVSTDAITLPEIFHDFETAVADLGSVSQYHSSNFYCVLAHIHCDCSFTHTHTHTQCVEL